VRRTHEMLRSAMEAAQQSDEVIRIGAIEIRPGDGLVIAGGRALTLSVREFGLLVALARSGGGIVRREDLYARVWGGELRSGDRSIDVYIHKLRVKLEEALPDWRFIHTHVGFGYRFSPEPSHPFHNGATSR
jgi:DNA-binding response OmpR family regulator